MRVAAAGALFAAGVGAAVAEPWEASAIPPARPAAIATAAIILTTRPAKRGARVPGSFIVNCPSLCWALNEEPLCHFACLTQRRAAVENRHDLTLIPPPVIRRFYTGGA